MEKVKLMLEAQDWTIAAEMGLYLHWDSAHSLQRFMAEIPELVLIKLGWVSEVLCPCPNIMGFLSGIKLAL